MGIEIGGGGGGGAGFVGSAEGEYALFAKEIKINVNYKNGVSLKKFNVEKWKREEKMRGLHLFFSFSEQRGFEIIESP